MCYKIIITIEQQGMKSKKHVLTIRMRGVFLSGITHNGFTYNFGYAGFGNPLSYRDGMEFTWEGRRLQTASVGGKTSATLITATASAPERRLTALRQAISSTAAPSSRRRPGTTFSGSSTTATGQGWALPTTALPITTRRTRRAT